MVIFSYRLRRIWFKLALKWWWDFCCFPFKSMSRDRSRKNPQRSEVVMSLNPVTPHLKIVVNIFSEHKKKSILFEPFKNDLESHSLPCRWLNGSNNLHSRQILTIPPETLVKGSFPSIASTILWFSFRFLFIIIMMSVIAACRGWSFLFVCCIINHCCLIIVVSPTVSICPLQGLYMVMIVVR